jgi:hypothetical protein
VAASVVLAAGVAIAAIVLSGTSGIPASRDRADAPSSTPTATDSAITPPEPTDSAAPPAAAEPSAPVPIDQPAAILPGVTAAITKLEAVDGEARAPGEVSAPSIRVTVEVTNSTEDTVDLTTTVVTAYFQPDQTPALELGEPGSSPMPASVAPGQAATGVYIFTIPSERRQNVRIIVDYAVDVPALVFEGGVPA